MRTVWYLLGAFGVAAALACARDVADPVARAWSGTTGASRSDGSLAPEVAVLEFVLPSGKVVEAELHGEVFVCFVPEEITSVRIRAYYEGGRLLRDAVI